MLVHGTSVDLGPYDLRTGSFASFDFVRAVWRFSDKSIIVACQSWPTSKSTLIGGTSIQLVRDTTAYLMSLSTHADRSVSIWARCCVISVQRE